MNAQTVRPSGRGFLLFDSHPAGCARFVDDLALQAGAPLPVDRDRADRDRADRDRADRDRPVVLIIGASAGYGLAATVTGIVQHGVNGVAVSQERPGRGRRTATAGWYRTARTAELAAEHGSDLTFVNADCFARATKDEVLDLVAERFGRVDHLVYSVAAPRRTDPATGVTHESVLKPIGSPYLSRALAFDEDAKPKLNESVIEPASDEEIAATVAVMGGEDWEAWVRALVERGLTGDRFSTVALSYLGAEPTAAIYRKGSIGAAKEHLERTAHTLDALLRGTGGSAFVSVNGATFTQASAAIPGMALYLALLHRSLAGGLQTPVEQLTRLWGHLTGTSPLPLDAEGRVRLDDWELLPDVQAAVGEAWQRVRSEDVAEHADTEWVWREFRQLHGFDLDGVDYEEPVPIDVAWPAPDTADSVRVG
ncbi:enoyl-[acyl-carrier-protein] reductase FabV [Streptomyces sp. NBC_00094]|uniref:enoyl-[acyl-carrier-protein] reductase FabV n=1 Tax=Streptomyces sp. NBC_00094 TaxID=2903620 RepID=UPI00224FC549|nr:enoyl-[acyl-carrier-protein] reductase FabV [Streptomyces sp. NBC_00094]MCX5391940.1 enoyl-[acyl-carrier-protein] reductase FabV [Streptomyces sp. NBC_00094]